MCLCVSLTIILKSTKNVLEYKTKTWPSSSLSDICQPSEMFAIDMFPARQRYCNIDRSPVMLPLLNSTTYFEQPLAAKWPLGERPRVHLAAKRYLGFVVEFNNFNNYNITVARFLTFSLQVYLLIYQHDCPKPRLFIYLRLNDFLHLNLRYYKNSRYNI